MVSGLTQTIRAGQMKAPLRSVTSDAATSMPRAICRAGAPSGFGTGSASVTDAPASDAATAPSGSNDTTTIGSAPPDHAASAIRRTRLWPSTSASADSGLAARITAATVTASILAAGQIATGLAGCAVAWDNPPAHDDHVLRTRAPDDEVREHLRNLAIVAHVDHGKTTLVDAMLRQTGAFRANEALVDRVLDSGDLEREKGITILAKQTTVDYDGVRLNIVDTPGHADFGGEVERSLLMVDSVLLLVDAAEGPLPQTRYVLQKAMARRLPVVVAINKIDRGDARAARGARRGLRAVHRPRRRRRPDRLPRPVHEREGRHGDARPRDPGHGPAAAVRQADRGHAAAAPHARATRSSCWSRISRRTSTSGAWRSGGSGTARSGWASASPSCARRRTTPRARSSRAGRSRSRGSVTALQTAHGIDRVDIEEAGPGDIVSVAGLPDVTIGDTLTDPADPRPLPRLDVDAPTLRMTFGVNTSPLSGREGKYVTSRQIKARLDRELLGNVSIEVYPTISGDTFEVRGRGELQLAVLIEQMRREGYELTASRPEVILRETADGLQEPYERITVDIPPEYIGEVQPALSGRKGRLEQMSTDADGRVRLEYVLPVRGLIGYRGQLLTETRGTALLHQIGEGYGPWAGEVTHRTAGVLVSDRTGTSNAYGLFNLQERAELFIGAGVEVYEGMVVGENSRSGDMDVNPAKEKKLTNIRTHAHDEALRLTPPRPLTLEAALEFIAEDELVEVTPHSIRLRKRTLAKTDRERERGKAFEREREEATGMSQRPGIRAAFSTLARLQRTAPGARRESHRGAARHHPWARAVAALGIDRPPRVPAGLRAVRRRRRARRRRIAVPERRLQLPRRRRPRARLVVGAAGRRAGANVPDHRGRTRHLDARIARRGHPPPGVGRRPRTTRGATLSALVCPRHVAHRRAQRGAGQGGPRADRPLELTARA